MPGPRAVLVVLALVVERAVAEPGPGPSFEAGYEVSKASWTLHLASCRSVHTVGMRFTLDLLWLDRHGGLVRLDEAVAARRLRTCPRAHSVVEARAGSERAFADALERDVG